MITFYLNPEAKWSNGEQVTAGDYVWSWHRALHPNTGNEYSYMLFPVVNAEAYLKGKITDFNEVGVKALDDTTLQVTLNAPTPYFIQLMDHYSTFAVHPETLLQFGEMTDRYTPWTRVDNIVSNGAFKLTEWSLNRRIIVEKSEHYWDRDKVSLNHVIFYPTENVVSEERMFRAEQLHYTQVVPLDKIPLYREMPDSPYVQAPYLGTYYYLLNTQRPPVDDVRVRKALAMSVDRDKAGALSTARIPRYRLTRSRHPDTLGYFPPKLFDYDPDEARRLLAEAGYPNGEGWPGVEILYNTQEAHRKIAVAIQQMWKSELGIDVTISNQEWKVYLDAVTQIDFQVARRGWIGDYVDANNFLDMFITGGGNNNTHYSDPVYDDLILYKAPKAVTREERYALFTEAETMLMEEMPIIPLYTYTSKHLIHPSVEGLHCEPDGFTESQIREAGAGRTLPEALR